MPRRASRPSRSKSDTGHKDVEFRVRSAKGTDYGKYRIFHEAASAAMSAGISSGGATIDVIVRSLAGAHFQGGDELVEALRKKRYPQIAKRMQMTLKLLGP